MNLPNIAVNKLPALVAALILLGMFNSVNADVAQGLTHNNRIDLDILAQKMDMPILNEKQGQEISTQLSKLKPFEVLELKKKWRSDLVVNGKMTALESLVFPAVEKAETIFSEKIQDVYGEDATIFNISFDEFAQVEKLLSSNQELIDLMRSVETGFAKASSKDPQLTVTASSSCYYDSNWPSWLTGTTKSGTMYKSGGSGRVRNGSYEWPCDFVLYIPANTYTRVTGSTTGAQCIVNWSNGLSASPSKDAVIIGYGRAFVCGSASESWIQNEILFKK